MSYGIPEDKGIVYGVDLTGAHDVVGCHVGKNLIEISDRRYKGTAEGLRTIAALSVLCDKVIQPLLGGTGKCRIAGKHKNWSLLDEHYRTLCISMKDLFRNLGIAV
jgi:hypothetical protein